jgi:outer membrane murein-binding lipoprotein Lpp
MRSKLILAAAAVGVMGLGGCGGKLTPEQVEATRQGLTTAQTQIDEEQARIQAEWQAAYTAGAHAAAVGKLELAASHEAAAAEHAKTLEKINKLEAQLAKATAAFEAAVTPEGTLTPVSGLGAIGPLLPPPWGLVIGLATTIGGIVVQQFRVWRETKAAKSIVKSVDALRRESPPAAKAMSENRAEMREPLTARAEVIVDETRKA